MVREASLGTRNASSRVARTDAGPWSKWRIRTLHGRAIRFMETYCVASKGHRAGQPLKLARFQKEWLEEVLVDGVDSSVLTLPRGQGKSTFCGGVATWATFDEKVADQFGGKPDVPVIAPTLKQARKGVYGAAIDFRRNCEELSDRSIQYTATGEERIFVPASAGELYPAAGDDPDNLQGLDPMLAFIDEIGFISVDAWDAMLLAAGKRPRNLILGLGTRNPSDDPNALDHLVEQVELHGDLPGFVLLDFSADPDCDIDDRKQWRKANPAIAEGFLRMSALENARRLSPPAAFKCFRLNLKSGSHTGWLGVHGPDHWTATQTGARFSATEPMWVGVDKSAYSDSSAVVQLQCLDGVWHARARVFVPEPVINHGDVKLHIRNVCDEWNVEAVGYDDRYMVEGAQELADDGYPMVKVPQTPQRLVPAYSYLYEALTSHAFAHDDDPLFRAHVLGAVAQLDQSGGFTLKKGKSKVKIDAAVALGIARAVSTVDPGERYDADSFKLY